MRGIPYREKLNETYPNTTYFVGNNARYQIQFIAKGAIYYVIIATVVFSRVKVCFRTKAHLVFHWCHIIIEYYSVCYHTRLRAVLLFSSDHASNSAGKITPAFLSGRGFLVRSINRALLALRSIYRALQKLGKERGCSQSIITLKNMLL